MSRKSKKPAELVSAAYLFRKVASEEVVVETESGPKKMTRWEAVVRAVQHQALSKNPSAIRLLAHMRKKFPGKTGSGGTYIDVWSDNSMKY
jgi:hypothetical protein